MDRIWDSFRCIPRHLVTSYQVKVIRGLRGQKWQGKIGPWPSHNLSFQFSSKTTTDQKTLLKRHKSGKIRKSEKYQILRKYRVKMAVLHSKLQNSAVFQEIGLKFCVLFIDRWSSTYVFFLKIQISSSYILGNIWELFSPMFMFFKIYEISDR